MRIMEQSKSKRLAIDGGKPVRSEPWPARALFGQEEKAAAVALFDEAIAKGKAFGYGGEQEISYCREFAELLGGGFADAVNSGTSAVYVALRCLELEPFSEVIVPPVTDPGGVMPVPLINCIPIPADSAPDSYNAGPEQIEARITERTSAIIVAHIAGLPVDMDPIMEVAQAKGIPVLEDCAQAHLAKYKGRYVGTIGQLGVFSTMNGKHHSTGGQGGLVYCRNEDLCWRAKSIADRGKPFNLPETDSNIVASLNLNINELSCAIGRAQLKKLPQIIAVRRRIALAIAEGCRSLRSVKAVVGLPQSESAFWFLFFKLDLEKISTDKDTFVNALQAEGFPVRSSYWHVPSSDDWFRKRSVFGTSGYPWTSPEYKGDPAKEYPLPNIQATDARQFRLLLHEKCGPQEVADTLTALRKVEKAFLK